MTPFRRFPHLWRRRSLTRVTALTALFVAGLGASVALVRSSPGHAAPAATAATTVQLQATVRDVCAPGSLSAPAGAITLVYTNALDDWQSFGIVGVGTGSPDRVREGGSSTLTATLAAGTYTYWCGDDASDGMRGTLTVTASGGSTTTAPPPSSSADVTAYDDYFSPAALTVPAGQVTLTVRNGGQDDHTFTVGNVVNVVLAPGQTKTVTFTVAAGTHRFVCAFHGGMGGNLTAQGSAPPPGTTTTAPTPTTTTPTTTAPPPTATSDVVLSDFAFSPRSIAASPGTVNLTVRNTGQVPHTFTVDGLVNASLQPGETKTLTFQATDGTYQIYCAMPGHPDLGMTGTLVVGSAGPGGTGTTTTTPTKPAAPPQTGDVVLNDFSFSPGTITVSAGSVSLRIANNGRLPHTFTVDGLVNISVAAGQSTTVTFDATPGTYRLYCAEAGHAGLGMVGTLVVVAPGEPVPATPTVHPPGAHEQEAPVERTAMQAVALPAGCRPTRAFVLRGTLVDSAPGVLRMRVTRASKLRRVFVGKRTAVRIYPRTKFTLPHSMLGSGPKPGDRLTVSVGRCKKQPKLLVAMRVVAAQAPPKVTLPPGTVQLKADARGLPKFDRTTLEAPAGKVTIRLVNPSPLPHNIGIEGYGVGKTVANGGVSVVTAELKPGTYTFYCAVPGHAAAGMKGTLTVR
jgi:plastocyanin